MARPTARGLALAAMAAGTYLAARILGTWELYLLAFAFLAAVLVSWLVVHIAARGLEARRDLNPARPVAGDDLTVTLRVRNRSAIPGLQVTFRDAAGDLGADGGETAPASLRPREQLAVGVETRPAARGVHRLPALAADAEDPLGLVRAHRELGDPLDVMVYPRLARLTSCVLFSDLAPRGQPGRRGAVTQGASEFRGIRPHYPGEPLSRVDWKSTAKTGNLMLREMEDPASSDVTVLLDGTAVCVVGGRAETNYESALRAAGSAADFALRAGQAVDLLLHESRWRRVRLTPDSNGRRQLLETLAGAAPDARAPLHDILRWQAARGGRLIRTRSLVVAALSLDEKLVRALIALRREGAQVSVVCPSAASFASATRAAGPPAERLRGQQLSLASWGILCLELHQGDDLATVLSMRQTKSPTGQAAAAPARAGEMPPVQARAR